MIARRTIFFALAALWAARAFPSTADDLAELGFAELYEEETVLSPKCRELAGRRVAMTGYMAPPLKAEAAFFVLTGVPMAICPFCESEAQWPDDIVLVLTGTTIRAAPFNRPIRVTGVLEIGFAKDPETGFVSLVRLVDAEYERL